MSCIVKVTMANVDTGEETVLIKKENSKREDSRCFFVDWFPFKNCEVSPFKDYEVQLRIDDNNTSNVDPILDVDIRDKDTLENLPKDPKWHHKHKTYDPKLDRYIYDFKGFANLEFRVYTKITRELTKISNAKVYKP